MNVVEDVEPDTALSADVSGMDTHRQQKKMRRAASLAVVFPLAHVARLFTAGTAAATVEARTTREMKILENMAKFSEEESVVDVGVFGI